MNDKIKNAVSIGGLLRLRCPCCGSEFGTYLHSPQASVACRCGATILLEHMAPYSFTCPCCERKIRGKTNVPEIEITVACRCGNPVTMRWDARSRSYRE